METIIAKLTTKICGQVLYENIICGTTAVLAS